MTRIWILVFASIAIVWPATLYAADEKKDVPKVIPFAEVKITEPVVFDKHVFPILAEKCIGCHDAEGGLAEGELDLLTVATVLKGGKKGASIVPGKGAESLLVKLSSHAAKPVMPPKDETPLTPEELTTIKLWIDQGAKPGMNLSPADSLNEEVVLGELPPGVHPVYALDMDKAGNLLAAGRANQVFVYDIPSGGLRAQLKGHQDIVQSVALSPDGQWLATGGYRTVKVWKLPRDVEKGNFAAGTAPVKAIAVSPDGKLAATASDDKTVRLWDLATNKQVRDFAGHTAPALAVAFSPDGALLATGCADKKVRIFQVADSKLVGTLESPTNQVACVAFSKDKKWLAAGGLDNMVRLWEVAVVLTPPKPPEPAADKAKAATKDKPPAPGNERVLTGHSQAVRQLAFTADAVVSASLDGTIRVWTLADGKQVRAINHGNPVVGMAVSPAGDLIASGGNDKEVKVWKLADGAAVRTISGNTTPVPALAFSRDGKELAVGAAGDNGVRVWDPLTGQLLHAYLGHTGAIEATTFGADANTVLSASADKTVKVWDASGTISGPTDFGPFADRVVALDFSPDSKQLAIAGGVPAANGELMIWDVATAKQVQVFKEAHSDTVFGVAFSPDGKLLASVAADKFLKVHDIATAKMAKSFEGHTHHVLSVGWKADGKQLATASADNAVKIWNYETGEQIRTVAGHNKQVTGVEWVGTTADVVTSCADKTARLIDSNNGGTKRGFGGSADFLYCIAVSADGKRIAAGGQEGKIFVWDGTNAQIVRTFEVPQPPVVQAAK